MKKIFLVVLVLTTAFPHNLFAWGKKGHGIIAEIAFTMLDSNTQHAVQKYLGTTTIGEASTWMDDVRSDHSYDYMKTWHYVNIEKGKDYTETKEDNLVNALNKAISNLENKDKLSDEDIKKNLMVLFHLTGDLHMPLHIGYADDKGGNDIKVKFLNNPSNLHRIWDTEIIEHEGISAKDCLGLYNNYNKREINGFKEINVEHWIQEPRSLLTNVYDYQGDNIDQAYIDKNKAIMEQQLLIAGIRLAAVLDQVFKS